MCLAIPGRIVELAPEGEFAVVEVTGVRRRINVELLRAEGLAPDDWVLIHVGFAMSRLSEAQAVEQLRLLALLGEAEQASAEIDGYRFE